MAPHSFEQKTHRHHEVLDAVTALLEADRLDMAKALLDELPPADVAAILEDLDEDLVGPIFQHLDVETEAEVLGELEERTVHTIAEDAPVALEDAAGHMDPDEMADVLDMLPDDQAEAILHSIPDDQAEAAERLMAYDSDTAGGLMTTEFVVIRQDATCREAISTTQAQRDVETISHLFVADEPGRLVGHMPLHRLVFAAPDARVLDLMETDTFAVAPETDQEELVRSATKYDLEAVPVVDTDEHLIGVVTLDDILEAAEEEVDEDMYRLAGTGERDPAQASVYRSSRLRLPWLMLSVFDGLFIAFIISHNESIMTKVPALLFFLPLIPLMGGQVAIQASTIMVRGIAVGSIRRGMLREFMVRQFFITIILAVCCALAAGLLGQAVTSANPQIMLAVGIGVFTAILIAGMMGMTLPLAFNRIGIDPAVSAGPFITMLNDLICIFIYILLGASIAA